MFNIYFFFSKSKFIIQNTKKKSKIKILRGCNESAQNSKKYLRRVEAEFWNKKNSKSYQYNQQIYCPLNIQRTEWPYPIREKKINI